MMTRAQLIDSLNGRLLEDLQLYQANLSDFGMVTAPILPSLLQTIRASRRAVAFLFHEDLSVPAAKDGKADKKAKADTADEDKADVKPLETDSICRTAFMSAIHYRIWLGYPVLVADAEETTLLDACEASVKTGTGTGLFHDIAVLALYRSPHEMPLLSLAQLQSLTVAERNFYLAYTLSRPVLRGATDDVAYSDFAPRLLGWFIDLLQEPAAAALHATLLKSAQNINLGEYYVAEIDAELLLGRRQHLIGLILRMSPDQRLIPPFQPRPRDPAVARKIRVGFLARTLKKGPDSESLFALFRDFDTEKFEVIAYTIDHFDRVVTDDKAFDAAFDRVLSARNLVRYAQGTRSIVEKLRGDDLDIFILANSTHFGVGDADLLISHRVAPIQISSNTVNPLPTSVGTFDYFLTSSCQNPAEEITYAPVMEPPIFFAPTSICYPFGLGAETQPVLSRQTIGLTDTDVMFYNGSSLDRLREDCLRAFMQAVAQVPDGKLVLAPFNSGWSGNLHSNIFWHRLTRIAADLAFPMDRVVVVNEMTVTEARNMVDLCDVYLASWPHGGATTVTLALDKQKPVVVKRRASSRSIDQFLISSAGLSELFATDAAEFVQIAAALGQSAERRTAIRAKLLAFEGKLPFFDVDSYSPKFQALLTAVCARHYAPADNSTDL